MDELIGILSDSLALKTWKLRASKRELAIAQAALWVLRFAERAFSCGGFPNLQCLVIGDSISYRTGIQTQLLLCRNRPAVSLERDLVRRVTKLDRHILDLLEEYRSAIL